MILVLCLWFPVLFCILPSCVVCYFSFPAIVSFSLLFSCCLHLHCLSLLPVSLAFPAHHLFGVIFPHLCCSTSLRMHLLMSVCVHSPLCSCLCQFIPFSLIFLLCDSCVSPEPIPPWDIFLFCFFCFFFFFIPCVFIDLYFSFRCPLFQILWCNLAFFFGIDTYWFCFLWLLDYSAFSLRACFSSIFSPVFLCLDPNCALLLPPGAAKHVRLLFGAGVQWVCHGLRQLSPLLRLLMKKNQSSFNFWYFDFILLIICNLQ